MEPTESFWNFSVTTYRRPGVADACLSLQDRLGIDVNVLLYCCWHGWTRGPFDDRALDDVLTFAEPWADEVVRPLRAARTWMKLTGCIDSGVSEGECMALREKIKAVEFEAEHLQQKTLECLTTRPVAERDPAETIAAAATNLRRYFDHEGVRLDGPTLSELTHIVTNCGDGAELETVTETITRTFSET